MLLLIDNYDSFTYNLAHLFGELGVEVRGAAERRDHGRRDRGARAVAARDLAGARVVPRTRASPRPRCASSRGGSPMLGVCLGHQAIVRGLRRRDRAGASARPRQGDGGEPRRAAASSPDCRRDFAAGRYHSLAATAVPDCLEVSATAADGEVMAVRHRELRVDGVQFHPESVLTPLGAELGRNFLEGK